MKYFCRNIISYIMLVLLFLGGIKNVSASGNVDSLYKILNTQKGKDRLKTIGNLSTYYESIADSLAFYSDLGLKEAIKNADSNYICVFLLDKGNVALQKSNLDTAIDYANQALQIALKLKNPTKISGCYTALGIMHRFKEDYDKSIYYHLEGLKIAEQDTPINYDIIGTAFVNIGNLYCNKLDYKKSFGYFKDAYKAFSNTNYKRGMLSATASLANAYYFDEQQDSAAFYYKQVVNQANEPAYYGVLSNALFNLGYMAKDNKRWPESIKFFREAYNIRKNLGNKELEIASLNILAEVFIETNLLDSAYTYLQKAKELNAENALLERGQETAFMFSTLYEKKGNFSLAYKWYKEYHELSTEIQEGRSSEAFKEISTKYEVAKKEQENERLEAEKAIFIQEKQTAKVFRIALICVLVLFIILFVVAYNLAKTRKTKIAQQNRIMDLEVERNKERETALSYQHELEVTKNNLLQDEVATKQRELVSKLFQVSTHKNLLIDYQEQLKTLFLKGTDNKENTEVLNGIESINNSLDKEIKKDDSWKELTLHFEKVFPSFFSALRDKHPNLSKTEERICAYLRIQLSNQEIANLLMIDLNSMFKGRQRLKDKLGVENAKDIEAYLIELY